MRKVDFLGKTLMLGKREGRDGEGQGSLAHCSPWGLKELETIKQLNNNNKTYQGIKCFFVYGKSLASLKSFL